MLRTPLLLPTCSAVQTATPTSRAAGTIAQAVRSNSLDGKRLVAGSAVGAGALASGVAHLRLNVILPNVSIERPDPNKTARNLR
jgi:hypothetical protein